MERRVVIIEDERDVARLLEFNLRGAGFAVMNLINFFYGIAVLGFSALVPLYAEDRYGLSSLAAGTLLTARAVGMIAVAALATFALRRTGYRPPMIAGFLLSSVGLVMLALAPPGLTPYVWLAVSAAVTGIGVGIGVPASNNAVLQLAPESTAAISGLRADAGLADAAATPAASCPAASLV